MWRGNGAVEIKWKARGRLEKGVVVYIPLVDEWNAAMAISDVTHRSGLRFEGGEKDDLRRRRACLFISFLMGNGYDV
ncbi:hypothetical protein Tco_0206049 [Tanacetum coccineum]